MSASGSNLLCMVVVREYFMNAASQWYVGTNAVVVVQHALQFMGIHFKAETEIQIESPV